MLSKSQVQLASSPRSPEEAGTKSPPLINHRTLVGRRRRAFTETKIVKAAIGVFAERGPDAPVIDDFIRAAGIARGTFYNYFKSTEELLAATSNYLSEELMNCIEARIVSIDKAAIRYGVGLRLWMRWAQANPSWCLFIARIWNLGNYDRPLRDIGQAIKDRAFSVPNAAVAWDVISGGVRQAMFRIAEGGVTAKYGDQVAQTCLNALGVNARIADEIMKAPLPHLMEGD